MKNIITKVSAFVGLLSLVLVTALTMNNQAQTAHAASNCDRVNIVYCGLTGNDASGYIASLRQVKSSGNDGNGHNDMSSLLDKAGFTDAQLAKMNTSNTKVGTLYKDGHIVVDGKTVANDTWIAARFTDGSSDFVQIASGVYERKTTTSMMNASDQVLVVFDDDGKAVAGIVIRCGNMLRFTAVTPQPVKVCDTTAGKIISVAPSKADQYGDVNSAECQPKTTKAPVSVCNQETGLIESVPAEDVSKYENKDSASCKSKVCDASSHTIKTVPKADANKYLPADSAECVKMSVCIKNSGETTLKTIYKNEFDSTKHSTDTSECAKPTPAATPLPSTGPEALIGGVTGAGALGYGAYTYAASRRAVRNTLHK